MPSVTVDPERVRAVRAELQADLDRLYAEIGELGGAMDERLREALAIEQKLTLIRERFPEAGDDDA
jgi:hypothetical protein